jgi:hypothetical protein
VAELAATDNGDHTLRVELSVNVETRANGHCSQSRSSEDGGQRKSCRASQCHKSSNVDLITSPEEPGSDELSSLRDWAEQFAGKTRKRHGSRFDEKKSLRTKVN